MTFPVYGLCLAILLACFTALASEEAVSVGALFSGKALIVIGGKAHLLAEGESSPSGVKLISANSEMAILEIDGKQLNFKLGSGSSFSLSATKEKRPAIIRADEQGMYRVRGKLNGERVEFLVDTGATMVALSRKQADSLGIVYEDGMPTIATTAGGEVAGFQIKLRKIQIKGITRRNVDAVVLDGGYPPQPLLGASFLNSVEMVRHNNRLELHP